MTTQSEAALENGLIKTLIDNSYERVIIKEEENLKTNFKVQLEKHNQKELQLHGRSQFTDKEFEKILIYLEGGTRFEKAKKLRDLYPLETEDGERIWVEFLNQKKWCQNEFQVANQIAIEGHRQCRYDVTILINGLPLVQIELKKRGVELKQAYNQIQRYHKTSFHGLFDYIQLFCQQSEQRLQIHVQLDGCREPAVQRPEYVRQLLFRQVYVGKDHQQICSAARGRQESDGITALSVLCRREDYRQGGEHQQERLRLAYDRRGEDPDLVQSGAAGLGNRRNRQGDVRRRPSRPRHADAVGIRSVRAGCGRQYGQHARADQAVER